MTCNRVRFSSASASFTFASATRISGFSFSAWVSRSSRPGLSSSLPLAALSGAAVEERCTCVPGTDSVLGCCGCCPWAVGPPASRTAVSTAGLTRPRLFARVRIAFLLLSGVLQHHEQPAVVRLDGQVLVRSGVERLAVAAHRRLVIALLGDVAVAGLAVGFRPRLRAVERLPLLRQR